jgi:hypothetical protein
MQQPQPCIGQGRSPERAFEETIVPPSENPSLFAGGEGRIADRVRRSFATCHDRRRVLSPALDLEAFAHVDFGVVRLTTW